MQILRNHPEHEAQVFTELNADFYEQLGRIGHAGMTGAITQRFTAKEVFDSAKYMVRGYLNTDKVIWQGFARASHEVGSSLFNLRARFAWGLEEHAPEVRYRTKSGVLAVHVMYDDMRCPPHFDDEHIQAGTGIVQLTADPSHFDTWLPQPRDQAVAETSDYRYLFEQGDMVMIRGAGWSDETLPGDVFHGAHSTGSGEPRAIGLLYTQ